MGTHNRQDRVQQFTLLLHETASTGGVQVSKLDKIIVLIGFIATLASLVLFAAMSRWELEPDAEESHAWKLDRLTGKVYTCSTITFGTQCYEVPNAR